MLFQHMIKQWRLCISSLFNSTQRPVSQILVLGEKNVRFMHFVLCGCWAQCHLIQALINFQVSDDLECHFSIHNATSNIMAALELFNTQSHFHFNKFIWILFIHFSISRKILIGSHLCRGTLLQTKQRSHSFLWSLFNKKKLLLFAYIK